MTGATSAGEIFGEVPKEVISHHHDNKQENKLDATGRQVYRKSLTIHPSISCCVRLIKCREPEHSLESSGDTGTTKKERS
eukprot:scaffold41752_cov45-Attheya_sp.AAC.1